MQSKVRMCATFVMILVAFVLPARAQGAMIGVDLNGRALSLAQPPLMMNGRVLVPLRGIFEALGARVRYIGATRTITAIRGESTVTLVLGNPSALVNGSTVTLDVPAQTVNGSTMVPLRFVAEALGANVRWLSANQTVFIDTSTPNVAAQPAQPAPPPHQEPDRDRDRDYHRDHHEHHIFLGHIVANDLDVLHRGDTLTVEVSGTPHCRTQFELLGLSPMVDMQETNPGQYRGTYVIPPIDSEKSTLLVVHLHRRDRTIDREAQRPVRIAASRRVFLTVSEPQDGQRVPHNFVLRGTTTPMATVQVVATVERPIIPGVAPIETRQTLKFSGIADGEGNFAVPVSARDARHASLWVQAVNRRGRTSPPVQLSVRFIQHRH